MGPVSSRTTLLLFLPVLLFTILSPAHASDYQTKHLFLVIIDGLRNDEAFEDSVHQYIPRIWNDLRPSGTIYTNLYSTTLTYTTSGHTAHVSGTRNNFPNADTLQCEPFRPRFPTIFEYFRKSDNIPRNKVWVIAGKGWLSSIDYSLYPGYGEDYAAVKLHNIGNDSLTIETFNGVLDNFQPSLVLLNLRDVDSQAHTGDWEKYIQAITTADSLVWNIWERIESAPYYQGTTTLFVTTDHGRHDDMHGGFPHHGGTDHGSQHLFFLAIGPDIKQDTVVTHRKDITDITPTIGELLGFETPFAGGMVMSEMIIPPSSPGNMFHRCLFNAEESGIHTRVTYSSSMSISPSVAETPSHIHLIWTESDSLSLSEKKRVMYARKDMMSGLWDDAVPLFTDIDTSSIFLEGSVLSSGSGGLKVVARGLFERHDQIGKPIYQWAPVVTTSENGEIWSATTVLEDFAEDSGEIIPSLRGTLTGGSEITLGWITGSRWVTIKRSSDGGASFSTLMDYHPHGGYTEFYLNRPSFTEVGTDLFSAFECNFLHYNRIPLVTLDTERGEFTGFRFIDRGEAPSFGPEIAKTSSKLHFVWSEYSGDGDEWQVYYRNSNHDGSGLSDIINLSNSPVSALDPRVEQRSDSLYVVWEDHRYGKAELLSAVSVDEGIHWYPPSRLTYTAGSSIQPSFVLWEDLGVFVWQDNSSGNWEIYYQETPVQFNHNVRFTEPVSSR